jgi:entericidin B
MRKLAALSLIAASLALTACNTVAGVGRDLQAAGQAVTGASNDARR